MAEYVMHSKVDATFQRFLTLGAVAVRHVMDLMVAAGLNPIELERYSSSDQFWSTKVKRLRVPDLLCAKTGLRVEVRAKCNLAIRMSDAPGVHAQRWFTALGPDDIVAFVHCPTEGNAVLPVDGAELFWVRDLQAIPESQTKLGPPRGAVEGSERDREWPTIVARRQGRVVAVTERDIHAVLEDGREQVYRLRGMTSYVRPGDGFLPFRQFLAGMPERQVVLSEVSATRWNPRILLNGSVLDQYVAAKALGAVGSSADLPLLDRLCTSSADPRVCLESSGAMAKLGDAAGFDRLMREIDAPRTDYTRMEAVLLLSELGNSKLRDSAADALFATATRSEFAGDEVRQAAIWGLGHSGLRAYSKLIPILDAENENERTHAVAALGRDLPVEVVDQLVALLGSDATSTMQRAACLRVIPTLANAGRAIHVLDMLARNGSPHERAWAAAALGSMPPQTLDDTARHPEVLSDVLAVQLVCAHNRATRTGDTNQPLDFLEKRVVRVFLSHSSLDKPLARRIASDLRAAGYHVWIDEVEIHVGHSIPAKIQEGLARADFVVVLLTRHSSASGWVEREWQSRIDHEIKERSVEILPIRADDCEVPLLLRDKKYADLRDYEAGMAELLRALAYHKPSGRYALSPRRGPTSSHDSSA